jgi:hypothetical protein
MEMRRWSVLYHPFGPPLWHEVYDIRNWQSMKWTKLLSLHIDSHRKHIGGYFYYFDIQEFVRTPITLKLALLWVLLPNNKKNKKGDTRTLSVCKETLPYFSMRVSDFSIVWTKRSQIYVLVTNYLEFFTSAIDTLKTLVIALGAGLAVWGVINLLEGYGNDNRATLISAYNSRSSVTPLETW